MSIDLNVDLTPLILEKFLSDAGIEQEILLGKLVGHTAGISYNCRWPEA